MTRRMLVPLLLTVGCGRQIDSSTPGIPELVEGNHAFAFDLQERFAAGGGNAFFSPFSVSGALAMTYAGAAGETSEQMHDTLHLGLPDDELHPLFGDLMADLDRGWPAPYELRIANRLFGQEGYDWDDTFLDVTRDDYRAPLEELDFDADAEGARTHINGWVEDETRGNIQDILGPGSIGAGTALVLANATWFKGRWEHGFDADATQDAAFTLLSGDKVQVPMMSMDATELLHGPVEGGVVVELPYKGGELAMDVFVPDEVDGLAAMEAALDPESMAEAFEGMVSSEVRVEMPRVELSWKRTLDEDLAALAMVDAFDPEVADFSGMLAGGGLHIDTVIHQAFVSIDEEGTEAAAATVVVSYDLSFSPSEPIVADHPYLFVIRDLLTGSVLFMGRVEDPS